MTGSANRARSLHYRNAVILYLHAAGLTSADTRPELKGLTAKEREANDVGDIVGLPWTLGVRCQQTIDLSGAQDQVLAEAKRAGSDLYASIQQRRGRSIAESYVTMPLLTFLTVLRAAPGIAEQRTA
jgi:hypothetical protein